VSRVITDKCIFDRSAGELTLAALYPGVTVDDVRASVGWDLKVSDKVGAVTPPSPTVLDVLRKLSQK
jgi:glutaconate CoA-transferase, subunit B